jgi:hypothetical protein
MFLLYLRFALHASPPVSFRSDVAVGLTNAWVIGLSMPETLLAYELVGTYVERPFCWAISTGASRDVSTAELKGGRMNVPRVEVEVM